MFLDIIGAVSKAEQGTYWSKFNVTVVSEKAQVIVNIFDFPGWRVFIDGIEVETFIPEDEEWGRMWIEVPKGKHLVYVQFFNTPVRTAGNVTSLVSWAGLLSYPLWRKRIN